MEIGEKFARSDFERLWYALTPRGKVREITRIVSHTVSTAQKALINDLKKLLKDKVDHPDRWKWEDERKLITQINAGSNFDFDLYLAFQDSTTMKFKDILGEGIADRMLSITGRPITDVKATELKATEVWMEVCVTPSLARYKLFQLLRAHLCLSPSQKEGKEGHRRNLPQR